MIKLLHSDEINKDEWFHLLQESRTASYFQSPACFDFICSLSFLKGFVYGLEVDGKLKGTVSGYIIENGGKLKRFFSKRAIIHGGALLADDISDDELKEFLRYLKDQLKSSAIYIEFRNNFDYNSYRTVFEDAEFYYQSHLNYLVKTENKEAVNNRISESKRRQIRKAKEAGVKIYDTKEQKDIDQFYTILSSLYKRSIRKPLFPKEFFEKLVTLRHAHLFVAKYNHQVISGMACVELEKKFVYEWFVCGDKEKFNHLYPSVAITNGAIEYAVENGFGMFDFMGAGIPDEPYGVREFKEKFGGELVEYGRFIYVNNKLLYHIGKIAIRLLRKY